MLWQPAPGDRFTIDQPNVVGEVFWISHLTIDVHTFQGQPLLGFNGTTEWALDSVTLDTALWLPREDQLRELLGERLVSLQPRGRAVGGAGRRPSRAGRPSADPDAECAYALALLSLT